MSIQIIHGDARDALRELPDESVHCTVTSPPYFGLRDYGIDGQIGLEHTPSEYVKQMVDVFREVRHVLRHDGTLWLNLGDSYSGSGKGGNPQGKTVQSTNVGSLVDPHRAEKIKRGIASEGIRPKNLIGIPWMVAFALREDGWYLRQDIIWHKPNPMPESVRDRCTRAHEYIFLFSKSPQYYYDSAAIAEDVELTTTEPGKRNKRDVWTVAPKPFFGAHFATFPPKLIEPCILAGCPKDGTVLDPFFGAGTTGLVAQQYGRNCIGIELNAEYIDIAWRRLELDKRIEFE